MDARSGLSDLYADHLRSRGSRAPIAALVRLLAPLGISPPAVRTAVSRMAQQGWLKLLVRMPEGASYAPHPSGHPAARRGRRPVRLDQLAAAARSRRAARARTRMRTAVFNAEEARLLPPAAGFVERWLRTGTTT
ncbi:MAG TPA: hypothetical protein VLW50_24275 [Streptosporangiaceae bacterium]|nr:hypothetical protein [Streptosporangiaceae bacterium]